MTQPWKSLLCFQILSFKVCNKRLNFRTKYSNLTKVLKLISGIWDKVCFISLKQLVICSRVYRFMQIMIKFSCFKILFPQNFWNRFCLSFLIFHIFLRGKGKGDRITSFLKFIGRKKFTTIMIYDVKYVSDWHTIYFHNTIFPVEIFHITK